MNQHLLQQFFKKNTVDTKTPTAPAFAHFHILMDGNPESSAKFQGVMNDAVFKQQPGRKEASSAEGDEIAYAASGAQIIRIMRRHIDPVNQSALISKAMEYENEVVPEIVGMLKTSGNDSFIEIATRVLAKSKINVADELIGYYDGMRSPYVQSMVLVLLGFKADEEHIPWLIEQYDSLKKQYPNESYCEGAYYALYEIENRFYPTGKTKK